MAGDWIKMREDLYEDPAVMQMAEQMGINEYCIVGYCHRIWSWVSRQCHDGSVTGVTLESVSRVTGTGQFVYAMRDAGWLEEVEVDGKPAVCIPHFERHLSQTAKTRALAAERKRSERHASVAKVSRSDRDKSVTREEKRREEKKIELPNGNSSCGLPATAGTDDGFEDWWNLYPARNGRKRGKEDAKTAWRRLKDGERAELVQATQCYASDIKIQGLSAMDPPRFLKAKRWRDWLRDDDGPTELQSHLADLDAWVAEEAKS